MNKKSPRYARIGGKERPTNMATKREYKVIQSNNPNQLNGELNQLGMSGWRVVQLSTTQAMVQQVGTGHIVITVILEHETGG
ncbi:MAG TPA: hypothetical protein VFQ43_19985 [Nitrososphaera sp.]|nr:hypothetical protein [Nitrososphaera sp.]